jgi:phospholipid-transporting ATPase
MIRNFVPISLLVTMEIIHLFQSVIMMNDEKLRTDDIYAVVQSSNLTEELGQIEYVFSDKTGTLTKNLMVFKKISVAGKAYGNNNEEEEASSPVSTVSLTNARASFTVKAVDFNDHDFLETVNSPYMANHQEIM